MTRAARPVHLTVLALALAACSDRHGQRDDVRVVDARAAAMARTTAPPPTPAPAPSALPTAQPSPPAQLSAPMVVTGEATDQPLPPELRHLEGLGANQTDVSQEERKP